MAGIGLLRTGGYWSWLVEVLLRPDWAAALNFQELHSLFPPSLLQAWVVVLGVELSPSHLCRAWREVDSSLPTRHMREELTQQSP